MPERVLVVGLDAVEPTLVDRLLADGRLPAIASLIERGRRVDVSSFADLSGTVTWPSFVSGAEPAEHGIYNEWQWDPARMTVARPDLSVVRPFWKDLAARGLTVGALDVPFTPLVGIDDGFEIAEWGAHDRMTGRLESAPASVAEIVGRHDRHPYGAHAPRSEHPSDAEAVAAIANTAMDGIRKRGALAAELLAAHEPDFAIIVFTELHDAGHHLWHTVEPDSPMYEGIDLADVAGPTLADLYVAADEEIGRLVRAMGGDDVTVAVVSLSGMRAGFGWPQLLTPLLVRGGHLPDERGLRAVFRDRASLFAALKRLVPRRLKRLYHQNAAAETQIKLARSTMVSSHDWSRTRAFEAMQDGYGYCRLNVEGRERDGIVPLGDYESVREAIIGEAVATRADDGRELVADVVRPTSAAGPASLGLPDIVFHWTLDAERPPHITIDGNPIPPPLATGRTAHHRQAGFCIATGGLADRLVDPMPTTAFASAITGLFD